mgnify:CR=1 FL=1
MSSVNASTSDHSSSSDYEALSRLSWTDANGTVWRGWETKPRGLPVILFRHANGFATGTYRSLLQPLLREYDLVAWEIPGTGESETGSVSPGWDSCAAEAAAQLQALSEARPGVPIIGMGHSFGGMCSLLSAAAKPGLYSGLILLDPVIQPPLMSRLTHWGGRLGLTRKMPLVQGTLKRRRAWPSKTDAEDRLRGKGIFKGWKDGFLSDYVHYNLKAEGDQQVLCYPPEYEAHLFSNYTRRLWPSMARLVTPTCIIAGEDTYSFIHQSLRVIGRRYPQIECQVVTGGHCFPMQYPDDTLNRIRTQLAHMLGASS